MKILQNKTYQDLIEYHIRRPYQNMIDGPIEHDNIPDLIDNNPEWAECVFDRLSRIYTHMEKSFFPSNDITTQWIMVRLISKGVVFI